MGKTFQCVKGASDGFALLQLKEGLKITSENGGKQSAKMAGSTSALKR